MFGWGALFKVLIENNRDDFGWNQNRRTQVVRAVVFDDIGDIAQQSNELVNQLPSLMPPD